MNLHCELIAYLDNSPSGYRGFLIAQLLNCATDINLLPSVVSQWEWMCLWMNISFTSKPQPVLQVLAASLWDSDPRQPDPEITLFEMFPCD